MEVCGIYFLGLMCELAFVCISGDIFYGGWSRIPRPWYSWYVWNTTLDFYRNGFLLIFVFQYVTYPYRRDSLVTHVGDLFNLQLKPNIYSSRKIYLTVKRYIGNLKISVQANDSPFEKDRWSQSIYPFRCYAISSICGCIHFTWA